MSGSAMRYWIAVVLAMVGFGFAGCNPMASSRQGLDVMFETPPRIFQEEVYYHGRAIGRILDQKTGRGSVYKVTIQLLPEHNNKSGTNWVYYVDNGRLTAFRVAAIGNPTAQGENLCGFSSKAALNWFRVKTMLINRIYKTRQIADTLTRQFG